MTTSTRGGAVITAQDLDRALACRYSHAPRGRARMRRTMQHLLTALQTGQEVETYAQIKYGFWYKVYFFTPQGVMKSDTGGEHLDTKAFARAVIASQDLRPVPLSAVMEHWTMGGVWEDSKPLSTLLLRAWTAWEAEYYRCNKEA